ncbi:MAG: carboxylating nicotinate-nucleotide diphosphorylase [Opitutales bacterium]|nr:carboxylating nicotinate-nucleotide diphosphorylase [Opitutales bacterium]NRA28319.1 carboxylating nicotinate-nucleotide diphosphorylase [Opitutales bacterium]
MLDNTLIDWALREDAGLGDVTSEAIFERNDQASGRIVAKEDLTLAGMEMAAAVFQRCDPEVEWNPVARDGDSVAAGDAVVTFSGRTIPLLIAERTALNFLQNLSGIATQARRYAKIAEPYGVRIVDTRKTLPAYRALAKYAVRCGGCYNHRSGLGDGVLIKENHIASAGSLERAIQLCRKRASHLSKIEAEVVNFEMVGQAIEFGADVILLDNMTPEQVRACVEAYAGKAVLEVSGGIDLNTVEAYCKAGPDIISVGALTHSVTAADLSLLFDS